MSISRAPFLSLFRDFRALSVSLVKREKHGCRGEASQAWERGEPLRISIKFDVLNHDAENEEGEEKHEGQEPPRTRDQPG
ncbi:UNVERIFIED_CONTAM: hypothetical protein HHA_450050 [Hammondia hammondi]|eukprot:XP_008882696.1 hypothetical protein HHA_450050 [Hammondia hammondi]